MKKENKTTINTIEENIMQFPVEVQVILHELRLTKERRPV